LNNFLSSQVLQEWAARYNGIENDYDEALAVVGDQLDYICNRKYQKKY